MEEKLSNRSRLKALEMTVVIKRSVRNSLMMATTNLMNFLRKRNLSHEEDVYYSD